MKKRGLEQIHLIENHNQAYYLWKKNNITNMTIVHIDAHLDIMPDSTNNVTIGNFLYEAIREKIIAKLYWVVPGSSDSFDSSFTSIKSNLSLLSLYDTITPPEKKHTIYTNGIIKTYLFGIPIVICTLDTFPTIHKSVLLDIDIDFFIINNVKNNSNTDRIGKRKPWISPQIFVKIIESKIQAFDFLTIAYSVAGGYTPLTYKTIGDEIAKLFHIEDPLLEQRLLAGEYFKKYRKYFDKDNLSEAKKYLFSATSLNPTYLSQENTYGSLYLQLKDFRRAEKEFKKMLVLHPKDVHCLIGMGILYVYKRAVLKAKSYFYAASLISSQNWICFFYLGLITYKQKEYDLSKKFLLIAEKLHKRNFYPKYYLAKLYRTLGKTVLSEKKYREAMRADSLQSRPLGIELLVE